jgi:PBSX family phage terminase large subunit
MVNWAPFGQKSLDFLKTPISEDARITILEGSVRSSKTVTMVPKSLKVIEEAPRGLGLIVGRSKSTVKTNILNDLFETLGEGNYKYNSQEGELVVPTSWGSRTILVRGAKDVSSEGAIRGSTLAFAYVDEATLIPEGFIRMMLTRLSLPGARCYMTTNPDVPAHYLYTEFITNEELLSCNGVKVWHFELDDNPNLDADYVDSLKREFKGLFYKRFIQGLWVMGEGSIYDMWTDENLYSDDYLIPEVYETAKSFVSVDYGTTNPTVFHKILDHASGIYIHREYYYDSKKAGRQKTDEEYADDMDRFTGGPEHVQAIIVDPSAASFKLVLRNRGYRVIEADHDVREGISLVSTLIGEKILMVHESCKNTIREINSYVWDGKKALLGKEEPVKANDHAPDSLRYFVQTAVGRVRLKVLLNFNRERFRKAA